MRCSRPTVMGGGTFGCGQCTPCRINRRRVWAHRIMLEAAQYSDNAFVTLTYDEDKLPEDGSVSPKVLSGFIKRLRSRYHPRTLRYFGVGEYGDQTFRPHYHLGLFGYPRCRRGYSRFNRFGNCCPTCDIILECWGNGNIFVGDLTMDSAAYVAGYVTKKMTKKDDPRLDGKFPEFARMSLRPGVGMGMMDDLASTLMGHKLDNVMVDVPNTLRHGTHEFPLGRYLRRKLRERIGREKNEPVEMAQVREMELQPLRETAWQDQKPLSEVLRETFKGKVEQIEAREKLRGRKRTI